MSIRRLLNPETWLLGHSMSGYHSVQIEANSIDNSVLIKNPAEAVALAHVLLEFAQNHAVHSDGE